MMNDGSPPLCAPVDGTADDTRHFLSSEVGDGSRRATFVAIWLNGRWKTDQILGLSPRKAAYATWQYLGPVPEPTLNQINAAAIAWCGEKERETFLDDILYFRNNWRSFLGLRIYVERQMAKELTVTSASPTDASRCT